MKKLIRFLILCLLTITFTLPTAACGAKTITVECAPCTLQQVFTYTDEIAKEFLPMYSAMMFAPKTTLDGKELNRLEYATTILEEGEHEVIFSTGDDCYYTKYTGEGNNVTPTKVLFNKTMKVKIKVSNDGPAFWEYEYRKENGLWLVVNDAEWFEEYSNKYFK